MQVQQDVVKPDVHSPNACRRRWTVPDAAAVHDAVVPPQQQQPEDRSVEPSSACAMHSSQPWTGTNCHCSVEVAFTVDLLYRFGCFCVCVCVCVCFFFFLEGEIDLANSARGV